jgi:hypothetical protein
MNVKNIVKGNHVQFLRYRAGVAYYVVEFAADPERPSEMQARMFPVPIDDVGDATLEKQDKAILFMRWIRRAIVDETFVPVSALQAGQV